MVGFSPCDRRPSRSARARSAKGSPASCWPRWPPPTAAPPTRALQDAGGRLQDGRRRHQVPALPRRAAGGARAIPGARTSTRSSSTEKEWQKVLRAAKASGPDRARRRPSTCPRCELAEEEGVDALQGPLHGHGEPGLHPRGGRGAAAGALRHRRRARGRGARGARPRGRRRPVGLLHGFQTFPTPDRGDPLPRARGLEGALPRARRLPRPHRRRQRLRPGGARAGRGLRAPTSSRSTSRSTAARRASTTSRRSTPRTSTAWSSCCARPSAPRATGRPAESEGAKRYHRRDGALHRGRQAHPARRGADRGDARLQAHRRALRARLPAARGRTASSAAAPPGPSRPTRPSARTCSSERGGVDRRLRAHGLLPLPGQGPGAARRPAAARGAARAHGRGARRGRRGARHLGERRRTTPWPRWRERAGRRASSAATRTTCCAATSTARARWAPTTWCA